MQSNCQVQTAFWMNNYLFTFNAQQMSQQLQPYPDSVAKKLVRPQTTKPKLAQLKQKRKLQQINQLFETQIFQNRQKCKTSHINRKHTNIKVLESFKKNIQYQIPNLQHLRLTKKDSSKQNQMNFANIHQNSSLNSNNISNISPQFSQQLYCVASKKNKLFGIQLQILNKENKQKQSAFIKKMSVGKNIEQSQKRIKFNAATPKILYPESDKKLPSVFKIRNVKQSPSSLRNRINSSKTIVQSNQKLNIFEDNLIIDPLIRTKFRPQSMMISTTKKQDMKKSIKIPKKLVFDEIENNVFSKIIGKKVQQKIRNRSSHQYRRLKQLPQSQQVSSEFNKIKQIEKNQQVKNQTKQIKEKHESKQHISTSETIQTPKPKLKLKEKCKIQQKIQNKKYDLTCSITFQIDKKIVK